MTTDPKPKLWGIGTMRTLRPHWVLLELGVPYDHVPLLPRTEAMDSPEFLAVNPDKKVPVLQDGDLTMVESAAIAIYLGTKYADLTPQLIPVDLAEKARFFEWTSYVITELDAASLYVIRRHGDLSQIYGEAPVANEAAAEYFTRMAEKPARALAQGRPYLLGDNFSMVDILLASCLRFAARLDLSLNDELQAYLARMNDRPAYRAAIEVNYP